MIPSSEPGKPGRSLKVVVTGGHPGDQEYGCGGTVARFADNGHEVVMLYLNNGEQASKEGGDAPMRGVRVAEACSACEILGARPAYVPQVCGNSIVDASHYAEFRAILEAEQPDIVFTHWPIDSHADHRANWTLVYDAWLKMGRRFELFYYEVSNGLDILMFSPTDYVDVSGLEERKRAACYAHASQTPDFFYPLQERVAAFRGIESRCEAAEAYVRQIGGPGHSLP